jgi:hypothetical protein
MKIDELELQARAARERLQQTRAELKNLRRSAGDRIRQQRAHAVAVARVNAKRKACVAGMLHELFDKEGFFAEARRLGFDDAQLPLMLEQSFARRPKLREAFFTILECVAAALTKMPSPRPDSAERSSTAAASGASAPERASTDKSAPPQR